MNRQQQIQMNLAFAVGYRDQIKLDRANGREALVAFCEERRHHHRLQLVELRRDRALADLAQHKAKADEGRRKQLADPAEHKRRVLARLSAEKSA